ncbi:hypothetical protein DRN77_00800, partial [Methanosarcinales archaeon]
MNNRTTIMIAMVAVMMMAGAASASLPSGNTVGIYDNITDTNATYENKVVTLNFTVKFNTNNSINMTNLTFPTGFILPADVASVNVTQAGNISTSGFNVSYTNVSLNGTTNVISFHVNSTGPGNFINQSGNPLLINITNVTMPAVTSDTNYSINISAYNTSDTIGDNFTLVWIQVRNDD